MPAHWLEDYPANPLDFTDIASSDYEDNLFEWAQVAHYEKPIKPWKRQRKC